MTHQEIITKAIERAIENYEVSAGGRVWNKKTGREVRGTVNDKGYRYFTLHMPEIGRGKAIMFHRLVALVHIPLVEGKPHVNHKDGNRLNNVVSNLEWCTPRENVIDSWNRGRVAWNKGSPPKYHVICAGCGIRYNFRLKRQKFCSKRCAALVRGRSGHNDRIRDERTGRFLQAAA